ncbi:hypothetical protein BV011_01519B, partial [Haemophilus influenzae]
MLVEEKKTCRIAVWIL